MDENFPAVNKKSSNLLRSYNRSDLLIEDKGVGEQCRDKKAHKNKGSHDFVIFQNRENPYIFVPNLKYHFKNFLFFNKVIANLHEHR